MVRRFGLLLSIIWYTLATSTIYLSSAVLSTIIHCTMVLPAYLVRSMTLLFTHQLFSFACLNSNRPFPIDCPSSHSSCTCCPTAYLTCFANNHCTKYQPFCTTPFTKKNTKTNISMPYRRYSDTNFA